MRHAHARWAAAIACVLCGLVCGSPSYAQREGRGGILRGLIEELAPGNPEEIEREAREARDGSEALRLEGILQSRFADDPAGVRAALWVGLYYYGAGEEESALDYFERARSHAKDPELRSRAAFWCEQVRLLTGREPLSAAEEPDRPGFWGTLRQLARADRSIREGRRGEAEAQLLSLEGDARRAGLLGPDLARWGDVLGLPGAGRIDRRTLDPIARACFALPERIRLGEEAPPPYSPAPEVWSLQFGAFVDRDNAERLKDDLERRDLDVRIDEEDAGGRTWYRVRMGELSGRAPAESLAAGAARAAGIDCQIVRIR